MEYKVGQTVVYPHHGAAVIEAIGTRMFKGEERTFLTLKVLSTDMQIMVPAANADMVGLRPVVDQAGLQEVMNLLKKTDSDEPSNWSRRFKANGEKIASGEIKKVAEVVRDLGLRDRGVGLSTGEKRMLSKAREMLISELALARNCSEAESEALIEETISELYMQLNKNPDEDLNNSLIEVGSADTGETSAVKSSVTTETENGKA